MATAKDRIKDWQRKRIFMLARELGITTTSIDNSDDLHSLLLGITGESSLKAISSAQADKLIGELEHRSRFGQPIPTHKPGEVSEGQKKKIIALMCELRKYDPVRNPATIEKRVAGIIFKELGITAMEKNPYAWLKYKDAVKLIEIIKGYLDTAKRKASRSVASG